MAEPKLSWGSLLRTSRAAAATVAVTAAILIVAPQTGDMLAQIGDYSASLLPALAYHIASFLMAFSAWHWSRAVLNARFDADTEEERKALAAPKDDDMAVDLKALNMVPRLLFLAVAGTCGIVALRSDDWQDALVALVWGSLAYIYLVNRKKVAQPQLGGKVTIPTVLAQAKPVHQTVEAVLNHAPFGFWFAAAFLVLATLTFSVSAVGAFMPGALHWGDWPLFLGTIFPGPSAVLLSLGFAIAPLTILTYFADRFRFETTFLGIKWALKRPPVIMALALLGVITTTLVNLHGVRIITDKDAIDQRNRLPLSAMFQTWAKACAPGAGPVRPIIVAVSGGASRAGLWAARVLHETDNAAANSGTAIFAVSSVSGGSVGAAGYTAEITGEDVAGANGNCRLQPQGLYARNQAVKQALAADAVGPLLAGGLFGDIPRSWFGLPAAGFQWLGNLFGNRNVVLRGGDRAETLEQAFENNWKKAFAAPHAFARPASFAASYLSLFYSGGKQRAKVPLWIANGTDNEDGGRIITAPFRVETAIFLDSRDALTLLAADIPASTAIDNTDRFPFLSPSGELTNQIRPKHHAAQIIDGGYFENEGLQTAMELANRLRKQTVNGRPVQPIIVQATADADYVAGEKENLIVRCGGVFRDRPDRAKSASRTPQFLAPLLGLNAVRGAHSQLVLRQARGAWCGPDPVHPDVAHKAFFNFYLYKPSQHESVPLNWVLSRDTADYIWRNAMDAYPNRDESASLRAVLKGANQPVGVPAP